jgi:hypothetical protein
MGGTLSRASLCHGLHRLTDRHSVTGCTVSRILQLGLAKYPEGMSAPWTNVQFRGSTGLPAEAAEAGQ